MADAPLPGGSLEALVVDGGGDGEPRGEGEEGLCCCGHAHRVRDIPGQGGFTHIQRAARGSTLGRTAAQNSTCARRACPVRVDQSARDRFLYICRGANEHEASLHRRRARRHARASASSTHCSTTLAIGLKDHGNGTEETKKGLQKLGKQRIMKEAMALKDACGNWQGLSQVLTPLTGLASASPYFGLRAMGRLSFSK